MTGFTIDLEHAVAVTLGTPVSERRAGWMSALAATLTPVLVGGLLLATALDFVSRARGEHGAFGLLVEIQAGVLLPLLALGFSLWFAVNALLAPLVLLFVLLLLGMLGVLAGG